MLHRRRQHFRAVLVHHVPRAVDHDALVLGDRSIPLLLVEPSSLAAFLAFHDEHRAGDAPEEFQSLAGVKRLRRGGAVERVELPDPLTFVVLSHPGSRKFQGQIAVQSRVGLLQLGGPGFDF